LLGETFVSHTEPSTSFSSQLITLHSSGGGTSRKPGNFLLNWRKLFDSSPDLALATVGGAPAGPYVRGLIGLYVWNKIWRSVEEPISEHEAVIIEILWTNRDAGNQIDASAVLELTNRSRKGHSLPELSPQDVSVALALLEELRCIEWKPDGKIWLREWVRKKI